MTPKSKNGGPHENARGSAANQRQQQQLHTQKPRLLSSCLDACFGLLVLLLGLLYLCFRLVYLCFRLVYLCFQLLGLFGVAVGFKFL